MGLTTAELNGIRALWAEWVEDPAFRLAVEVKTQAPTADMAVEVRYGSSEAIHARVQAPALYLQVEVWRTDQRLFSDRVAYDADVLRASVMVLAGAIAEYDTRQRPADPDAQV